MTKKSRTDPVVTDIGRISLGGASGVVWSVESQQLNANLVTLDVGSEIPAHVNDKLDVLVIVRGGSGTICIDGVDHEVAVDSVVLVPVGSERSIRASRRMSYLTIHPRSEGLKITSR